MACGVLVSVCLLQLIFAGGWSVPFMCAIGHLSYHCRQQGSPWTVQDMYCMCMSQGITADLGACQIPCDTSVSCC